jgi:hypothetical protein
VRVGEGFGFFPRHAGRLCFVPCRRRKFRAFRAVVAQEHLLAIVTVFHRVTL